MLFCTAVALYGAFMYGKGFSAASAKEHPSWICKGLWCALKHLYFFCYLVFHVHLVRLWEVINQFFHLGVIAVCFWFAAFLAGRGFFHHFRFLIVVWRAQFPIPNICTCWSIVHFEAKKRSNFTTITRHLNTFITFFITAWLIVCFSCRIWFWWKYFFTHITFWDFNTFIHCCFGWNCCDWYK